MTDYNSINIRTIQRMSAGSAEYQKFMAQMGDNTASKVGDTTADTELLFNTMQYYKTMEYADDWSDDAKALSVEDLIKLWRTEDDADKSFVTDFMEFNALMQGYSKTEPEDPTPPENEDFVRPYIPDDNLTDDQKNRMKDFDLMRAHDVSLSGDTENYPDLAGLSAENGDYELLFEYLRQREGTSFLYPSDYNEDGTLKESGQTKETEMIAKLQELCTADPTKKIGTVLNEFLEAYSVSEPTETQYGAVDSDKLKDMLGKGATTNIKKGEPKTITIGENEYLVTNIGDDNTTSFKYEVKSETKDGKTHVYIHMEGNNLRIQDVSGKLQGDVIELQGNGNEIDLGMGDDILSIIGENNRALMGDGDDKVYIQGDNNFSDLWRGDDSLFNIDNAYTIGIGFTGDDEFYTKGDNVVVNGESPHQGQLAAGEVGDGLYKDGVTEEHDIERDLTKPSWFPPTTPEEPEDPDEPGEHDPSDGPIIDFDGVRYRVYRKIAGKFDPTETIKYYKDDQNRTVFEANGWYIAVLYSLNDTNDKDYSNVVIKGDRNTLIGSKDNDKIDIQGSDNWISADAEDNIHKEGGDDAIKITSGTGNSIYGEYGNDSLEGNLDGNFFNILRTDIETINGQPVTPPDDGDDDDTDSADPAGAGTSTTPPTTNSNKTSESVDTVTSPYADTSKWENYSVASTAPTYALTNNGTYNAYTMALLGADSPEDLEFDNAALTGYYFLDRADYNNPKYFKCIREASDFVEMLDNMDGDATGTVTVQNILDMYNSCNTGENKDKDYAENMKTLCLKKSGVLEEDSTSGLAKIKSGFSNLDEVDISDLFDEIYAILFLQTQTAP